MIRRPLLIGPAPGPGVKAQQPLSGKAGQRLAALCGLPLPAYLATFERTNLLDSYPGPNDGKGDAFDSLAGAFAARELEPRMRRRRTVLLGQNVARAFLLDGGPLFTWIDRGRGSLVALAPHPSGVSRWWNDPENVRAAETFWKALAAL